jgi:beta-glucosidase
VVPSLIEKKYPLISLVVVLGLLILLFQMPASQARADMQPWMDKSLPAEQRARLLLAAMTLEEKLAMVYGSSVGSKVYVGHVPAIPRLGIPELNLQDGPGGVSGGALGVSAFPAPITVAASWDDDLMQRYGVAMAEEERDKGANVQLGPMMNIDRVPQAGRNFEGYGEDPYLAGRMAAATVRGIQSVGVIATAKHYIANEQEYQRTVFSSEIDLRTLHEIYLPPFKASVDAGVGAIMCSYNKINGIYACENPDTQNTILKDELGFKGWIMSDWGATHSTAASALGGMDMEMPSGIFYILLKNAVESGQVPESRIDDMVLRILTPMFQIGLFDRSPVGNRYVDVQSEAHQEFAREAAAEGMVLVKNDGNLLPIEAGKIHSIAVFGAAADDDPVVVGGGSGRVNPPYKITPLEGITERAGEAISVHYFRASDARGRAIPEEYFSSPAGSAGLKVQYFNSPDLSGQAAFTGRTANIDFEWKGEPPAAGVNSSDWSARWEGTLTPTVEGKFNLTLTGTGHSRLYLDGTLMIDNWDNQPAQPVVLKRRLTAGKGVAVRVEYAQVGEAGDVHLTWFTPEDDPNLEAAALAKQVDAAIVVVGEASSEGGDRQNLVMAGDELVEAVAQANPNTIVVVYCPAQVLLPWADQVPAILIGWIPGQESGHALADVLFGDINPAGKLPMTFAQDMGDYPANSPEMYPGVNERVHYSEGLQVGYRHFDSQAIMPLFPFGHGLSYTIFEYSNLSIDPAVISADGNVTVKVEVKNSGLRAGAEVVQLYLGFPAETGEPPRQLKGFQKITLQPGENQQVSFVLSPEETSFWSAGRGSWVAYPGRYQVMVGSSSGDIRQSGKFDVHGGPLAGEVIQAESAALAGDAVVSAEQAGYTGSGFVSGFQKQGAAVSFKVNASQAGQYDVTLRYSSTLRPGGQNLPRRLSLYVNGSWMGQVSLPNLANWEMWDFKSERVTLKAGENTVSYQYDAGDNGDVHLDALIVARIIEPTPMATSTIQGTNAPMNTPAPAEPGIPATGIVAAIVILAGVAAAILVLVLRRQKAS